MGASVKSRKEEQFFNCFATKPNNDLTTTPHFVQILTYFKDEMGLVLRTYSLDFVKEFIYDGAHSR